MVASIEARGKSLARGNVEPGPDDPALSFVDNRVEKARRGASEIVAVRAYQCGPSCACPPPCVELFVRGGPPRWVDLKTEAGDAVTLPEGASADVTGRFTGRTRAAAGGDGGATLVPELRVLGAPTVVSGGRTADGARAEVLLAGKAADTPVPEVKDDRPYLVIVGAFPIGKPRSEEDAARLFVRVVELGFSDAERHDSRAFAALPCCDDLVVAGRFADPKSADARKRQLVARGLKQAQVKAGF